jgi:xanthine dehydrogenase YagT iron-sulfur-binding subunit
MPDHGKNHGSEVPPPCGPTRRAFLRQIGATATAAAATIAPFARAADQDAKEPKVPAADPAKIEGTVPVSFRVNGQKRDLQLDPRTTLLDCLREELSLTGTKKGCDHGQCGACTVHINGRRVNSCLSLAVLFDGDEITTIEGLGQPGHLHPVQAAFLACDGYQCGYCTSGQMMSAAALLKEPCGPLDEDVKEFMSGNICRCGAYSNIVEAIQKVRQNA